MEILVWGAELLPACGPPTDSLRRQSLRPTTTFKYVLYQRQAAQAEFLQATQDGLENAGGDPLWPASNF